MPSPDDVAKMQLAQQLMRLAADLVALTAEGQDAEDLANRLESGKVALRVRIQIAPAPAGVMVVEVDLQTREASMLAMIREHEGVLTPAVAH